ncbi:HEPN domain-containing protein [Spirosoma flavum]|uniref:HEPN domain-containing protein n=1 Tax=Spirosoma flavum TaxID=2048557 RepID=A0ABW6ARD0_9BACT
MRLVFDSSRDFISSQRNIKTLLRFASKEDKKGNENNRNLFLKLALVLLVTRFQVFIESILKEFDYDLKQKGKTLSCMPDYYRMNSFSLTVSKKPIHKEVENPQSYNRNKVVAVQNQVGIYQTILDDNSTIDGKISFNTKFPMGKNGLNEITDLFKQIEGKNIFDNVVFDVNKINEILSRRHAVIHEDKNQQITETTIESYLLFLIEVTRHMDQYLRPFLLKSYKPARV